MSKDTINTPDSNNQNPITYDDNIGTNTTTDNANDTDTTIDLNSFKFYDDTNKNNLPVKPTGISKFVNFLFTDIKVELTPYEQKVEDEINEFLYQDITFEKFKNFLFKEITFGKKKKTG